MTSKTIEQLEGEQEFVQNWLSDRLDAKTNQLDRAPRSGCSPPVAAALRH